MRFQQGFLAPTGRPYRKPAPLPCGRKHLVMPLLALNLSVASSLMLEFAGPFTPPVDAYLRINMYFLGFAGGFLCLALFLLRDEYRWK
jgi:hypothetical protein